MTIRLRELIRAVRACKTAAEERDVIAKECASIRTAFKDEDNNYRHRNVAKLLFIHMLGYPTHFGQMECLKLIASPKFPEKRIGYLGLMLLLDESQEVLMLVTNSLQNDMRNSSQYTVGLALCALGDIGSADICRDLSPEVEKLTASTNSYVRKKAALCAIRICRKCPEMIENYIDRIANLLSDRNHGVLVSGLGLLIEICELAPSYLPRFRKLVPALVRMLKNLVLSGFAPEHDVDGITDPFLQVKVLQSLRLLGAGDAEASEQMTDILASVATNTEASRNAGTAILYECVLTITGIESEKGLRVLAVNILGRFLVNRDNNVRYVALNTLAKTCADDIASVQRHRNTVLDCLRDPDVSIRRRALELLYLLVNEGNVKQLARELLNFLMVAGAEFKEDLTDKVCTVINKYPPSKKWQVDMLAKVLVMAGEYVSNEVGAGLVQLISTAPELQIYSVHKLFHALEAEPLSTPKKQLVKIGIWVIGEYGELLSMAPPRDEGDEQTGPVSEKRVIDLLEKLLVGGLTPLEVKKYSITALMKLTTRLDTGDARIRQLIANHRSHIHIEMQQRACEYTNLFEYDDVRRQLLEHMPTIEDVVREETTPSHPRDLVQIDETSSTTSGATPASTTSAAPPPAKSEGGAVNIMDELFGLDLSLPSVPSGGMGGGLLAQHQQPQPQQPHQPLQQPQTTLPQQQPNGGGDASANPPPIVAFQQDGLVVRFEFLKNPTNLSQTQITAVFTNTLPAPMSNFVFQAAVPKFAKLQMTPASSNVIPPNGGAINQKMHVNNTMFGQKTLAMRLKFDYAINGSAVSVSGEVSSLPANV